MHGDVRRLVFHHIFDLDRPWGSMIRELDEFYAMWNPQLVLIDRTGPQGKTIFEGYLVHLGWALEGWEYNLHSKGEIMNHLKILIERQELEMWDDDSMRKEFMSVEEKIMPNTGIRQYPKPEDSHDDQVQSIGLACMAMAMIKGDPRIDEAITSYAIRHEGGYVFETPPRIQPESPFLKDSFVESERGSVFDLDSPSSGRRAGRVGRF
jgi:hypothetical protein